MSSEPSPENIASGNTAHPGVAPRQIVQRADGTEVELVSFSPGDPTNPRNWPTWRKWSIVITISLIDLTVSFTASGFSPPAKDFGVSGEVATLGLSLCVLGFALGPMTLAPLSEYDLPFLVIQNALCRDPAEHLCLGTMDGLLSTSPPMVLSYSSSLVPPSCTVWVDFWSCDSCLDGSLP